MKLNYLLPHAGVCLALALAPTAPAQQQKQQPAKPKTIRSQAKKTANQAAATAPATAGAVIVKDWESGPGATRAPQPGDFPPAPQARVLRAAPAAAATPTIDGGIELIDPENLQTTMVVSKTASGKLVYGCKQAGDHATHQHAKPVAMATPRVEVE